MESTEQVFGISDVLMLIYNAEEELKKHDFVVSELFAAFRYKTRHMDLKHAQSNTLADAAKGKITMALKNAGSSLFRSISKITVQDIKDSLETLDFGWHHGNVVTSTNNTLNDIGIVDPRCTLHINGIRVTVSAVTGSIELYQEEDTPRINSGRYNTNTQHSWTPDNTPKINIWVESTICISSQAIEDATAARAKKHAELRQLKELAANWSLLHGTNA